MTTVSTIGVMMVLIPTIMLSGLLGFGLLKFAMAGNRS